MASFRKISEKKNKFAHGFIDVGDGCWWHFVLMTILRCVNFENNRWISTSQKVTNKMILLTRSWNCHWHKKEVIYITVAFASKHYLNSNKFFYWCTDKYEMDGKGEFSTSFSLWPIRGRVESIQLKIFLRLSQFGLVQVGKIFWKKL